MSAGDGGLELSKHEAAGNDFLVLVDDDPTEPVDGGLVRALCHRHRGVGADGVLRLGPGGLGADVSMELWNADGSPAEMSGNGIRALVQAAVHAGWATPPLVTVATAAGLHQVDYQEDAPAGGAWAGVAMGTVTLEATVTGTLPPPLEDATALLASVGNPHLVVVVEDVADPAAWVPVPALAAAFAGGVNVELVAAVPGPEGTLALRVHERGAGETLACGTGSCAVAAVGRSIGLCGDTVDVVNPGGTLQVVLRGAATSPEARLSGPVRRVADVRLDRQWLEAALGCPPVGTGASRGAAGT